LRGRHWEESFDRLESYLKELQRKNKVQDIHARRREMAAKLNVVTKDEPLVVERTFDAPVALVWKALTDKEDIKQWSFDLREFAPVVGFEFQFDVEHEGVRY